MVYTLSYSRGTGQHAVYDSGLHSSQSPQNLRMMLVHPAIYVILQLPLTIIRLVSISSTPPSKTSYLVTAALSTSSGWMIVFFYALSRHKLHTEPLRISKRDISNPVPISGESTQYLGTGNTTIITGKGAFDFRSSYNSRCSQQDVSPGHVIEGAIDEDAVSVKTTVDVFYTPAPPTNTPVEGSVVGDRESLEVWHTWA